MLFQYLHLLLSLMICLQFATTEARNDSRNFLVEKIEDFKDQICTADVLENATASSDIDCARKCFHSEACSSYFFNTNSKKCLLRGCVLDVGTCPLSDMEGTTYYQLIKKPKIGCPAEAVENNYLYNATVNICYGWRTNKLNWTNAQKACQMDCDHLLLITNDVILEWMRDFIEASNGGGEGSGGGLSGGNGVSYGDHTYIDGTDVTDEGIFKNYKNENMTYIRWDYSENDNDFEDCLVITRGKNHLFADVDCARVYDFMCQVDV